MLHIIYRAYGGENRKGRPPFHDKFLSMASLVQAVQRLPAGTAEIVFISDGEMPDDRMRLMQASGEVLAHRTLGMAGSLYLALNMPRARGWPDDDIVWFAEDDYLYRPEAMVDLMAATRAFPEADYFGLYAMIGTRRPDGGAAQDYLRIPRRWAGSEPRSVNGHPWRRALSTTHTFGARVGIHLANDAMAVYVTQFGGAYDHASWLLYQGHLPYSARFLARSFLDTRAGSGWLRRTAVLGRRSWLGLYGLVRTRAGTRSSLFVSADPALITHCETEYMAAGTDWAEVAREIRARAAQVPLASAGRVVVASLGAGADRRS